MTERLAMTLLIRINSNTVTDPERVAELVAEAISELPEVRSVMVVDATNLSDSQTNRKDSWVDEEADVQPNLG